MNIITIKFRDSRHMTKKFRAAAHAKGNLSNRQLYSSLKPIASRDVKKTMMPF